MMDLDIAVHSRWCELRMKVVQTLGRVCRKRESTLPVHGDACVADDIEERASLDVLSREEGLGVVGRTLPDPRPVERHNIHVLHRDRGCERERQRKGR